MSQPPTIPFELQDHAAGQRMCGAAVLCMVYRSFGLKLTQTEVWDSIARIDAYGNRAGRTYLLAADAIRRGLCAVVVQARRPWETLVACWSAGVRVILNHRIRPSSVRGHFSVLAGLADEQARLHDPADGPARPMARADLLMLWSATRGSEIAGHVLVAVSQPVRFRCDTTDGATVITESDAVTAVVADQDVPTEFGCAVCGARLAESVRCGRCGRAMPLSPAVALGCPRWECVGRLWLRVFCPHCDNVLIELPQRITSPPG